MKSLEQIRKIEAIVLYVAQKFPQGVDYIKLFKILYFAQKDYLVNYGKVLRPDTFKARTFGPIPALSDKVIKLVELQDEEIEQYPDLVEFAGSIYIVDQHVFAKHEPNMDYLSKKECEYLDKWYEFCKDKDSIEELSPESHDEAYKKAWERYNVDPQQGSLTLMEIARAGGASEKMVAYIRNKELLTADYA